MKKRVIVNTVKKGSFSAAERQNIEEWSISMDALDIAQRLNRSIKQVEKYLREYKANAPRIIAQRSETEELRRELQAASNWGEIKKQFTDSELVFYENSYIEYRRQFKDMTHTEHKQLNQLITIDIFLNRHNQDRKRCQEEIDRIEKLLRKEYEKNIDSLPPKEKQDAKNFIIHQEDQLAAHKASSASKTKEYSDYLGKHTDIMKTLKGTRDQRFKAVEEKGKFLAVLEELEIASRRQNISEIMGLTDLAVKKEKERLAAPFAYADKEIDVPILNHTTVKGLD